MTAAIGRLLRDHWLAGAIAGAPLLLALLPLLDAWPAWLVWVFVQQPAYMLHQIEEHLDDRFRHYVNHRIAGGVEALTPVAVAVINIGGVWAVNAAALTAAGLWHPGLGLVAAYLSLVNALSHIAAAAVQRAYNPGLASAVGLFLPCGGAALVAVAGQPGVALWHHLAAIAAVLGLHGAIMRHVRRRMATAGHAG